MFLAQSSTKNIINPLVSIAFNGQLVCGKGARASHWHLFSSMGDRRRAFHDLVLQRPATLSCVEYALNAHPAQCPRRWCRARTVHIRLVFGPDQASQCWTAFLVLRSDTTEVNCWAQTTVFGREVKLWLRTTLRRAMFCLECSLVGFNDSLPLPHLSITVVEFFLCVEVLCRLLFGGQDVESWYTLISNINLIVDASSERILLCPFLGKV